MSVTSKSLLPSYLGQKPHHHSFNSLSPTSPYPSAKSNLFSNHIQNLTTFYKLNYCRGPSHPLLSPRSSNHTAVVSLHSCPLKSVLCTSSREILSNRNTFIPFLYFNPPVTPYLISHRVKAKRLKMTPGAYTSLSHLLELSLLSFCFSHIPCQILLPHARQSFTPEPDSPASVLCA